MVTTVLDDATTQTDDSVSLSTWLVAVPKI